MKRHHILDFDGLLAFAVLFLWKNPTESLGNDCHDLKKCKRHGRYVCNKRAKAPGQNTVQISL